MIIEEPIIELENKIVGCGGINFKDETTGVISWGIIHPEFQRKSFGLATKKWTKS